VELVDTLADTVRLVAQGRADAIVENIDFFMAFTENYPDVEWRVVENPIFVAYCAIGVRQGNDNLTEVLNILLYGLHSEGFVNATWEKSLRLAHAARSHAKPLLLSETDASPGPVAAGRGCLRAEIRAHELHVSIRRRLEDNFGELLEGPG
jgi:hypothetical protein